MFVPDGYLSSECSDEDDIEYVAKYCAPPTPVTEEQKHGQLLSNIFNYAQKGDTENTLKLIDNNNLEVDIPLHQNWTALVLAASYGYYDLTKALVDKGADVNQVKDMKTVLMHTCNISKFNPNYREVINIVKLLVENKCDVNFKNNKRMTAYLIAASNGNIDVVKYLRDFCDTEVVDNQGWNALFHAIMDNHYELVRYLLKLGMSYKKYDVRRNTPLDYARHLGFQKVLNLMPDEETNAKMYESYLGEHYNYKAEIANPRFLRDMNIMLYGMNCAPLLPRFQEDPSMNLFKFLTMTKEDLIAMDITKGYQLNRILGGLYEFHQYPFKYKAIPHIEKTSILSTYNIGFTMFSALRHYVTMQASLKYLRLNVTNDQWDNKVLHDVETMETHLLRAQKLIKQLGARCERWDKANVRVDLITHPSKQKNNKIVFVVPVVTAISIILYFKYHL